MKLGVGEWVWDSHQPYRTARRGTKARDLRPWVVPDTSPSATGFTPPGFPDCDVRGAVRGPAFAGGPGFASASGARATLGRKRVLSIEPPATGDLGAVIAIRNKRGDRVRRRLAGHTSERVFARGLSTAWIISYTGDGDFRMWNPRTGEEVGWVLHCKIAVIVR